MNEYTGDDLLTVFDELAVFTGNLNSTVIKAWFDTDCPRTKSLLNWFCGCLTKQNYIPVHENAEYEELREVFEKDSLEKETKFIEDKYPQLFDYETNLFNIQTAEEEIEILEEEESNYDLQIKINEQLSRNLTSELSELCSDEINSKIKKQDADEKCSMLCFKLDETNRKLYHQMMKYQSFLYNFQFDQAPQLLNSHAVKEIEEKFIWITSYINSAIKAKNESFENSICNDFTNTLSELQHRLRCSKVSCMTLKMEIEKLKHVNNFLKTYNVNLLFTNSDFLQLNVESKQRQQTLVFNVFQNAFLKLMNHRIDQLKWKYAQNELKISQSQLNSLTQVKKNVFKVLAHYAAICCLYSQEKSDIDNSDQFFKRVICYVNEDIQNCLSRNDAMLKIIDKHKDLKSHSVEQLIGQFGKFCKNGNQVSLKYILDEVSSKRHEIGRLEEKYFVSDIQEQINVTKNLVKSIQTLEGFLRCGPTSCVITCPLKFMKIMREIDLNLNEQSCAIKSSVRISKIFNETIPNEKWCKYRRQLWIHFINNPTKMLSMIEEIKQHSQGSHAITNIDINNQCM